jgi:hypothetical protein
LNVIPIADRVPIDGSARTLSRLQDARKRIQAERLATSRNVAIPGIAPVDDREGAAVSGETVQPAETR